MTKVTPSQIAYTTLALMVRWYLIFQGIHFLRLDIPVLDTIFATTFITLGCSAFTKDFTNEN